MRDIAKLIGRDVLVISREVKRHKPQFSPYNAELAQKAADRKAKKTNIRKLIKHPELLDYVYERMKKDKWSPEQIAGRLKQHPPPELHGLYVCHEQIYEYIQNEGRAPDGKYLYKYLPKARPKRQKRGSRKPQKVLIPNRESITKRPKEAESKRVFGHFEI
jgi:IS30 family transposase